MLVSTLKPAALHGENADDDYLAYVLRFGDTTEAHAQLRALRTFGIEAQLNTTLEWKDLDAQLARGIPVPIGVLHHGHVSAPTGGGHWIVVIGKSSDGERYFVHDPYGDMDLVNGGHANVSGKCLLYSKKNLGPRWMVEGPRSGWGIIVS